MRKLSIFLALTALCFMSACEPNPFKKVAFLEGTWKIEGKEQFEIWKNNGDNALNGYSFKMLDGHEKILETLCIRARDNQVAYEASVPNQNNGETIQFVLNPDIKEYLSFENPNHDFPQKIQYQKISDTEIWVNVLGADNKGFSFKMTKQGT